MPDELNAGGTPSLLEAARVLAHGGDLDTKLAALAGYARAISGATACAVLLFDPDAGLLISPDGAHTIDPQGTDALAAAMRDRRPAAAEHTAPRPEIQALLPAPAHAFVPIVAEEASGPEIEGLLVLGLLGPDSSVASMESVGALADLAAVAIRQARLQNALVEQSSYRDRLAHTDALTGLANRPTFEQMLELELARADRQQSIISVMLFDVDGLEQVTSQHGAGASDDVLRHVAATLASEVRLVDTVARLSGGQFGVIAPGEGGNVVAERIRAAVGAQNADNGTAVSVCVGIARSPDNGTSAADVLGAAKAALSSAKKQGPASLVVAGASATPAA